MGGKIVAQRIEEMARGQAERLMPLLDEVLAEAAIGWHDLDAVAWVSAPAISPVSASA